MHPVPNLCKKPDSHIIFKRVLKFPAQPSHFLGTIENYNICISDQEIEVFEVRFFFLLSSNLVLATEGIVLCKSRSILTPEGTKTLFLNGNL